MRERLGGSLAGWLLLIMACLLVGLPILWATGVALRTANLTGALPIESGPGIPGATVSGPVAGDSLTFFSTATTLKSFGVALLIGAIGAGLGWPLAWTLRLRGWKYLPLVATPLLLPNYLAFGAFNLLRAPGTWLGDWLEQSARGESSWIPVAAGKVLAVGALGLWSAPLGAIVLAAWLQNVDREVLAQAELDAPKGRVAAARANLRFRMGLSWPGLIAAAGLIALIMLGSAIPLHVARLETLTIRVWLAMDLLPQERQWRAWIVAWPVVLAAVSAAWVLSGIVARPRSESDETTATKVRSTGALAGTWCVLILSVVVPAGLFASHIASVGGLAGFTHTYREQLISSLLLGLVTGVGASLLMLLAWTASLERRGKPLVRASLFLLLISGLVPGVMVGVWISGAVRSMSPALESTALPLVMAHLARFGMVPVMLGCWMASLEPKAWADQRAIDGATGVWALVRVSILPRWPVLVAAALVAGILSFHEIESSIVVQPPGIDTLARAILNQLHFARTQELSCAGLILLGGGLCLGVTALWMIGRLGGPGAPVSRP